MLQQFLGAGLDPNSCWLASRSLQTANIRIQKQMDNALTIAESLETHPKVKKVYYPGLKSHPQHELPRRQQDGFGGILSFTVRGGQPEAWAFIDATRMVSITGNLGDVKTTITHPATTTHGRLPPEDKALAGVTDNLIRLSVGIEALEDLKNDMKRGLQALGT